MHRNITTQFEFRPCTGGLPHKQKKMDKPPTSTNPDIGNWEKHTKGIGLKLLQKFGFNGRLGAKENGVSRAIEVVVRPNNVGLGFGDIKEAAALKVNKKIEAEWRGVEFVDTEEEEKKLKKSSVERLAAAKGWKKTKTEKITGRTNLSAEDFINKYMNEDATQKPQQVIIDMRYKDARVVTDMAEKSNEAFLDEQALASLKPKLGEELLYNINLITNTEEMGVTRDSKQLAREVLRIRTLKEDKAKLEAGMKTESIRLSRLEKILLVLSRIEEKLGAATANSGEKGDVPPQQQISLSAVCGLIRTLHQNFAEEFQIFGLINLLPNLISRVIVVESWDPFVDHAYLCDIYDSLSPLMEYFEHADEVQLARQTNKALFDIIELRFLPVVRRAIASQWDAVSDPEVCVKLLQSLRLVLPLATFEQTVDMFLLPKLTATVASWRPSLSPGTMGIHTWLHPWLPLLTTKLSTLYPDIRRKFGTLLSSFDYRESSAVVNMLLPWVNVFDSTSFENLLVRSAMPRLVATLREELVINPAQQDITPVQCALVWSALVPALPNLHLACLWVGEFFPKWLRTLFSWLTMTGSSDHAPDYEEISTWYSGWKSLFPESLLAEEMVMDCFNLALDMMQTSIMMEGEDQPVVSTVAAGGGKFPREHPIYAFQVALERLEDANYYTLIEARKSVQRAQRRLEALNAEENLQYSNSLKQATTAGLSSSHQSVTFKEVVEAFAARNNVEFLPKIGRFFEGKQMWQFGRSLCYLDQNVVFVSTADKAGKRPAGDSSGAGTAGGSSTSNSGSRQELYGWAPIALDDLLNISK